MDGLRPAVDLPLRGTGAVMRPAECGGTGLMYFEQRCDWGEVKDIVSKEI